MGKPIRKTMAVMNFGLAPAGAAGVNTGPNPKRVGIIISGTVSAPVFISIGTRSNNSNGAVLVTNAGSPLVLTDDMIGTAIQDNFNICDSGFASRSIVWCEILEAP